MLVADPLEELKARIGLPSPLPPDPFPLLAAWFGTALKAAKTPNPDAMVLATAAPDGTPSARVVLCRAVEVELGSLVFFTNYASSKGRDIEANPKAACVFNWDHAGQQARIAGVVERVSAEESDVYFASRTLLARLGAWASQQSRPLASRADLITRTREVMRRFGVGPHHFAFPRSAPEIPRPPYWGGFRVRADCAELWVGGVGRLHDRGLWTRRPGLPGGAATDGQGVWIATRLQP